MDNRVFNVNGRMDHGGKELLEKTLELAFLTDGLSKPQTAVGYRISETHGFVLYKYKSDKAIPFPCPLNAKQVAEQVFAWLESDPKVALSGWDQDADHDGDNGPGWRVYCEDWGHVDHDFAAFVAITPAFMWCGK